MGAFCVFAPPAAETRTWASAARRTAVSEARSRMRCLSCCVRPPPCPLCVCPLTHCEFSDSGGDVEVAEQTLPRRTRHRTRRGEETRAEHRDGWIGAGVGGRGDSGQGKQESETRVSDAQSAAARACLRLASPLPSARPLLAPPGQRSTDKHGTRKDARRGCTTANATRRGQRSATDSRGCARWDNLLRRTLQIREPYHTDCRRRVIVTA